MKNKNGKMFVGVYELGYERVRLYLRHGDGANVNFMPNDKGLPIIEIGADVDKWRKIVAAAVHEAQEAAMVRLGFAHFPAGSLNSSTANCCFVLNHEQFDECCGRTGDLLATALPDLSRAWNTWRASKAKTKAIKNGRHHRPHRKAGR